MAKSKKKRNHHNRKQTEFVPAVVVDPREQSVKLTRTKRCNPVIAKDFSLEMEMLQSKLSQLNLPSELVQIGMQTCSPTELAMNIDSSEPSGILATSSLLLLGDPSLWNKLDEYGLCKETDTIQWIICCSNDKPESDDSESSLAWEREPGAQISGNIYPWRKPFVLYRINTSAREYLNIDMEMVPIIKFVSAETASEICKSGRMPGWSLWLNTKTMKIEEGSQQRCCRDACDNKYSTDWDNSVILCQCKTRTYCSMDCRNLDPHGCFPPQPTECSICCDELLDDKQQQLLVMCKHCSNQFHNSCLSSWLSNERTCPLCRKIW